MFEKGNEIWNCFTYQVNYFVEIVFKTGKLRKIFNSERLLQAEYGAAMGRIIARRMSVLRAARTLQEVSIKPPERRHELKGQRKGQFAVDLKQPHRLVFRPNHDPLPRKPDSGLDLGAITAIMILKVEDYH